MERFENHSKAHYIKGERKACSLLSVISPQMYRVLKDISSAALLSSKRFEELCTLLVQHYAPKKNKVVERFKFDMLEKLPYQLAQEYLVVPEGKPCCANMGFLQAI